MIAEATALRKIRLKDARASLGLSQKELARLAGLHYHVIGNCERGGTIRLVSAHAILRALNEQRALRKIPQLTLKSLTWSIEGEEND